LGLFAFLLACAAEERVRGVVIDVTSSGVLVTEEIALRTSDGAVMRFIVGGEAQRSAHAPSPGHLRSHMVDGTLVHVTFRRESGSLVALRIEDEP